MQRLASHYIWYRKVYRLHYIELDDFGKFVGVFPLAEEIAGTVFYDGVLIPMLSTDNPDIMNWEHLTKNIKQGSVIGVYQLTGLDSTAAKLGTYNSSRHSYIQRF